MIITLTGKPCSGKTSVAKVIKEKYNFKIYSVGELFKEEARKNNMSTEEFNKFLMSDPKYDNFIDNKVQELGVLWKNDDVLFDSRLAWFFIPHSFKVFLDLDEDEMAKRLANSDRTGKEQYLDVEKAKQTLISRFNAENKRYKKLYNIDNTNFKNYDLVLSSKDKTPEEIAEIIMKGYRKFFKL